MIALSPAGLFVRRGSRLFLFGEGLLTPPRARPQVS